MCRDCSLYFELPDPFCRSIAVPLPIFVHGGTNQNGIMAQAGHCQTVSAPRLRLPR